MTPLKFGIIGCSRIAKRSVIPAIIKSEYAELEIIGSRSTDKAKEFASEFNCEKFGSYEDVILDDSVDVVYISTPIHTHAEWSNKSTAAGKHVYVEKSSTNDLKSAIEMVESAKIVLQAIDSMPSGPLQAKVPKVIKVPQGRTYVRAENPKGEMGYYIVSDGGLGPYRLKVRTASFSNVSILPIMLEGALLPDLIAIMGSLDFVLGDVDR